MGIAFLACANRPEGGESQKRIRIEMLGSVIPTSKIVDCGQ